MNIFQVFLCLVAGISATWGGSISPSLIAKVKNGGLHDAILELPPVTEGIPSFRGLSRNAKAAAVAKVLQDLTSAAQKPYVDLATGLGIEFTTFWISNIIHLKQVDDKIVNVFENLDGNFILREPHRGSLPKVSISQAKQQPRWGVVQVGAPNVWNVTQGEGAVVASIDTGVNLQHEALRGNYAGAWFDPIYNATTPDDLNGHGSHTMGVMVGQTNGIGVAPGARWVSCRGLDHIGFGPEPYLTACAEFLTTAQPTPHVVVNAWIGDGGVGETWFDQHIQAWRAAGIFPVFLASGTGSFCGSIISPADSRFAVAVGRTAENDQLAPAGQRGPSPDQNIKPDLVAPGVNIVSAWTGDRTYITLSGSSSSSFLAGVVALIASHHPDYDVDQIQEVLTEFAYRRDDVFPDSYCGPGPDPYPNNGFGYGRVDARSVVS